MVPKIRGCFGEKKAGVYDIGKHRMTMSNMLFSNGLWLGMCLCVAMPILAQSPSKSEEPNRSQMRERMKRMYVAYLTEELDLTVEKGQRFWPIYNEFSEGLEELESRVRSVREELVKAGGNSLVEFDEKLDALTLIEHEFAGERAAFLKAVAQAFSPEFAVQMLSAKRSFDRDMRQRMGDRMSRPNRRSGPGLGKSRD